MKKILLMCAVASMFVLGCSKAKRWSYDEKRAVRQALNEYRQMIYLDDLTEAEFDIFANGVAMDLESAYPVYAEFMEIPSKDDTVEMVVVTAIVEELNTDSRNMRHIYPYDYLVAQGILPAGLTRDQKHAFYNCFAQRVNSTFSSMQQFMNAIIADTTNLSQIAQIEAQCANDLFDWEVVITEIVQEP